MTSATSRQVAEMAKEKNQISFKCDTAAELQIRRNFVSKIAKEGRGIKESLLDLMDNYVNATDDRLARTALECRLLQVLRKSDDERSPVERMLMGTIRNFERITSEEK